MQFAKIRLSSKGTSVFTSGTSGGFGIPLTQKQDTITVALDGYETLVTVIATDKFQNLVLQPLLALASNQSSGLMSLTKSKIDKSQSATTSYGGETYTSLAENNFVNAKTSAETSIALNINSASYSNIRRFLNMGIQVPPDGVRIEEMLNYFNLNEINNDSARQSFYINTQLTSCPWNDTNQLLFVHVHAPKISYQNIPPAKLIFLIDVSGSMDKDNRLPLVQSAFKFLVNNLRAEDTVGIVTYGGYVGIALPPTSGGEKEKIDSVIDGLRADGDTPGSQAIQTAYQLAEKIFNAQSNNRVILATDGDFNIGQTSDKELEAIVNQYKEKGIYLTCLGTGMGNYKDSRLEMLAKKGNGNFAYIDNMQEAQKTMVTEFTKNMYAVANNVSLQVRFNDKAVTQYRLIGYDNRKDAVNDTLLTEGGEIGSGQSTVTVFEIEPSAIRNQSPASIQLHYRLPQNSSDMVQNFDAGNHIIPLDSANAKLRIATAVCMFGTILKHSKYAANCSWETIEKLAKSAASPNNIMDKEFLVLIKKAKLIYKESNRSDKKKK